MSPRCRTWSATGNGGRSPEKAGGMTDLGDQAKRASNEALHHRVGFFGDQPQPDFCRFVDADGAAAFDIRRPGPLPAWAIRGFEAAGARRPVPDGFSAFASSRSRARA